VVDRPEGHKGPKCQIGKASSQVLKFEPATIYEDRQQGERNPNGKIDYECIRGE